MGLGRHPFTPPRTLPKPKYMSVPEGLANKMCLSGFLRLRMKFESHPCHK